MSDLSAPRSGRLSGRTKQDIDRDFRERCQRAAENILIIGYDLIEMKEICDHGEWLRWLASVGWKERTAQNYMKVAKAWDENPKLMAMGYTRTVALLAGPTELQDMAADGQLDDKSAAEIKRMAKEIKAHEETEKSLAREIERRDAQVSGLLQQLDDADKKLREREKNPAVVEKVVERIPEDYELLKRQLKLAEDAAEDAEARAAEAMRQAQEALSGQADAFEGPSVPGFVGAVNAFLGAAGHLPYAEDWLRAMPREDRKNVSLFTNSIWHWAEQMLKALDQADRVTVFPAEGAVVHD